MSIIKIIFENRTQTFINKHRFQIKKENDIITNELIDNIWAYIVKKQLNYKYYQNIKFLCLPHANSWILKPIHKNNDNTY